LADGVDDNIDLRVITEEELASIQALADKAEELANKTEESKKKAKQNIKEISDAAKKLGIGGAPGDIGSVGRKITLPLNAASGENAIGYEFGKTPIGGKSTTGVPKGMEERLTKVEKEATQAEKDAKEALEKARKQEEKLRELQSKYEETLGGLRNPFGYTGNQITKFLGKAGLGGMIALFGQEVVTDMFELVKSWFDMPGGLFDIRKKLHDAIYSIGDLAYQEQIANGNVFFTDDTRLYQHSPFHSNTEKISSFQSRYLYSSRYD